MSSRKSDNLAPKWNGWLSTILCNAPLPILFILVWWVGTFIDTRDFQRNYGWYKNIIFDTGFAIILAVSLQLINGFSGQFSLGHIGFMMVGAFLAAYPVKAFSNKLSDPGPMLTFFIALGITVAIVGTVLILLFWGLRYSRRIHIWAPSILIIVLFAWLMIDLARAANYVDPPARFVWTNGISSIAGIFNWLVEHGKDIGAKLTGWTPESWRSPLCIVIAMLGGASCAGVTGLVVGMPALRLRGDYLAIATLGMGEIINRVIILTPALGGALGLGAIPRIKDTELGRAFVDANRNGRFDTGETFLGFSEFAWLYGMVIVTIAVIWRLAYSAKGRSIMAVREDEIAASAVGIDTTHHKVVAFVIGAFFAGVAGALYAMQKSSIDPKSFTMQRSIEIVVMVTLGGLGSISGAILAAILLTILPELLRDPPSAWPWGFAIIALGFAGYAICELISSRRKASTFWVSGATVILLMMIAPYIWGLFGKVAPVLQQPDLMGIISCGLMLLVLIVLPTIIPPIIVVAGLLIIWNVLRLAANKYQVNLPDLRMVIYSLMLVLMMLLRPQGLLGGRELWPKRRAPKREAAPTEEARQSGSEEVVEGRVE
jgi:ABC-type branched-subunit amino acid transport system permease subunit